MLNKVLVVGYRAVVVGLLVVIIVQNIMMHSGSSADKPKSVNGNSTQELIAQLNNISSQVNDLHQKIGAVASVLVMMNNNTVKNQELIKLTLKANGLTDQQINQFLNGETIQFTTK